MFPFLHFTVRRQQILNRGISYPSACSVNSKWVGHYLENVLLGERLTLLTRVKGPWDEYQSIVWMPGIIILFNPPLNTGLMISTPCERWV